MGQAPAAPTAPRDGHPAVVRSLRDHRELWLSGAGGLAALLLPRVFDIAGGAAYWRAVALVALVVALAHGAWSWRARRRERYRREAVVAGIAALLRERVNDDLAVIALHVPDVVPASTRERIDDMLRAVRTISRELESLSGDAPRAGGQR